MPRPPVNLSELVSRARSGGPGSARAAGRLMSCLENEPARLPELLAALGPPGGANGRAAARRLPAAAAELAAGPAMVLGITGAPGTGKSTLTDALVAELRRRHPQEKVGVIAVDPSSPFSGGAVLGDRVRMMRHATDPHVLVRSLASRGHLGGLALGVRGVARVMAMVGCRRIIIETVGVGQSEVEVARVADLVAVVLAPGQGDSVQLLKAGLMEIGDLIVINKADRPGAAALYQQVLSSLELAGKAGHGHHGSGGASGGASGGGGGRALLLAACDPAPPPPAGLDDPLLAPRPDVAVVLASSQERRGIDELASVLDDRTARSREAWLTRRRAALGDEVREAVLERARQRLLAHLADAEADPDSPALAEALSGAVSVDELTDRLLERAAQQAQARLGASAAR